MRNFDPMRTPLKNARGLGTAKDGVRHFMLQRISAIALLFLVIYVVVLVIRLVGADFATARALVAQPFNATLLVAFLVAMFWHGQLGMQVVIEDYVHPPGKATIFQFVVIFVCVLAAIASIFAVVRIALGA